MCHISIYSIQSYIIKMNHILSKHPMGGPAVGAVGPLTDPDLISLAVSGSVGPVDELQMQNLL